MTAATSNPAPVELPVSDFAIPGMRCAGCISKLENGLVLRPGIVNARVNFTAKRVSVTHLPEMTMPQLLEAISGIGFEAVAISESSRDNDNHEAKRLLKAMAVAGFAMMNIMLLSVSVWSGASGVTRDLFHWLSALIALPTVAYSGQPFFRSAWSALRKGRTNMDVPISIGVTITTALSLYETFTQGPHAYFDGVVMLLFFLLTGRWLDAVMRDRARDGVSALLKQTSAGAMVLQPGSKTAWIDAKALKPNMVMLVAAGERLAADGMVTEGVSSFDLSLLTGETTAQSVVAGSIVHAGTLNLDAPVHVRVTAAGADTAIADIARLMEQASQGKSLYVRVADRAARLYAPAVHTLAALSFLGWMVAGAGWHESLLIAVAVLIITCPCALGLAVPAAQIVVAGALMRAGILVKDGSALERLAEVDLAMFDKTGTLTMGRPTPINLADANGEQKAVLLALARASRHPLSEGIRRALEIEGVAAGKIDQVREVAGAGVFATANGRAVSLGRPDTEISHEVLASELQIQGKPSFAVHFSDQMRPQAAATLVELQSLGLASLIISGDRAVSVAPVARALGITAQTSMLPQEKLDAIARQKAAGHKVLMVGDGLNDGPALAAGYASIAPASASDAGQNAADVVFMGDALTPVATAIRAARRTQHIVRQNFILAIGYNVLAVPLAIAGYVTPLIAAAAMSGSSLVVVANALRLKNAAK
ncbi:heavy metal translocating P-type ATPase [Sphingorhabdus sp.]|jgi:Cu2+-exporting ATPase|uniref:heavy metal translocating P-type ATPase n=1 Tax=Sphingorhabdus sp. TaxID=1902408 RepID=UPI0037C63FBC